MIEINKRGAKNEKYTSCKPWGCTHTHTHTLCLLNCNGTQEKVNKIKNRKKDSDKNLEIGFCCCLFCAYLLLNF